MFDSLFAQDSECARLRRWAAYSESYAATFEGEAMTKEQVSHYVRMGIARMLERELDNYESGDGDIFGALENERDREEAEEQISEMRDWILTQGAECIEPPSFLDPEERDKVRAAVKRAGERYGL